MPNNYSNTIPKDFVPITEQSKLVHCNRLRIFYWQTLALFIGLANTSGALNLLASASPASAQAFNIGRNR